MLTEEGGDFDLLALRRLGRLAAVLIVLSMRSLGGRRGMRTPWCACLNRRSGRHVVGARIPWFIPSRRLRTAQPESHIRGQPPEQGPGVPGFGFLFFFGPE